VNDTSMYSEVLIRCSKILTTASPCPRALEHRRRRYAITPQTRCRWKLTKVDSGAQPLVNEEGTVSLAVNGEIYNHRVLRKGLKKPYNFKTHSDCEVIIPLVRI
jgi:asparagine synthase (glutamine-hydrolysing)